MTTLDQHALELTCPQCSHKFKETIGRLKHNPQLTCGGCGTAINIQADELASAIKTIEQSLRDLQRKISGMKINIKL